MSRAQSAPTPFVGIYPGSNPCNLTAVEPPGRSSRPVRGSPPWHHVWRPRNNAMATLGIDIGCISVKLAVVGGPTMRKRLELLAKTPAFHDPETKADHPPSRRAPHSPTAYTRIKGAPRGRQRTPQAVMAALPRAPSPDWASPARRASW